MNLYNITEKMLSGLAELSGASHIQYLHMRYTLDKIAGGKSACFDYWTVNQKELMSFISEIKLMTKTRASKKEMIGFLVNETKSRSFTRL